MQVKIMRSTALYISCIANSIMNMPDRNCQKMLVNRQGINYDLVAVHVMELEYYRELYSSSHCSFQLIVKWL